MSDWPIRFGDVLAARERLRPHLAPSPLRSYPGLDAAVGDGIRVLVKHENLQPTGAFKVRNALSALTAPRAGRAPSRGVVAATRGNHGLGLAWAGRRLGVPVTRLRPPRQQPREERRDAQPRGAARRGGARLRRQRRRGRSAWSSEEGLHLVHSTNDPAVVAGAGTMTLEILEEESDVEALVFTVGGGSQAVGGLTVARERRPDLPVYAVQAAAPPRSTTPGTSAGRSRSPRPRPSPTASPRGTPTRSPSAPCATGLAGFVTVTDEEIAEAVRLALATTHTLVEGAGAAGLAGLRVLARDARRKDRGHGLLRRQHRRRDPAPGPQPRALSAMIEARGWRRGARD